MKKFSLFILLLAGLFADWKITQYTGSSSYGPITRTWITEKWKFYHSTMSGDSISNSLIFVDKETGKTVLISPPFKIEEL